MTPVKPECKANQKKKFNHEANEQKFNRYSNRVPHRVLLKCSKLCGDYTPGTRESGHKLYPIAGNGGGSEARSRCGGLGK